MLVLILGYALVQVALPKWSIHPFKPVQQSRQQSLRAYCPNIFTVPALNHALWGLVNESSRE